ncbi:hypothetical protein [Hymenobacter sp. UYP22]|uniref:hypothetical protein n=1 Tax=Hymenobacter sp. UYP22 TaxID=3156348 RepID=UPI003391B92D
MKKLLPLLVIVAPAFVKAYDRYCEAHPVEKTKSELESKPTITKKKSVHTRTITESVEDVSYVK